MKRPHCLTVFLLSSFFVTSISSLQAQEVESPKEKNLTEVVLLPTIHQNHLKSEFYTLERLKAVMLDIKPDLVCTEITSTSLENYNQGKPDRRLSFFPEYTEVILPLRKELGYDVIPCSAYSEKVNFKTVGVKAMDKAHYRLIAKALESHQGQGLKILITFGSGHINGLLEQLLLREDIQIVDYRPELEKLQKAEISEKP